MSATAGVIRRVEELLACFHRGSLDIPDDLIDRGCAFRLNGLGYEDSLGSPSGNPLLRMLGYGPVAYRFLAQGLRYSIPDVRIELARLDAARDPHVILGIVSLTGTPRGAASSVPIAGEIELTTNEEGRIVEIGMATRDDLLRILAAARHA